MGTCGHKTPSDFHRIDDDGRRVWRCSACKREGHWTAAWGWHGQIECKRCGFDIVNEVRCPSCPPAEAKVCKTGKKPRKTPKPKPSKTSPINDAFKYV